MFLKERAPNPKTRRLFFHNEKGTTYWLLLQPSAGTGMVWLVGGLALSENPKLGVSPRPIEFDPKAINGRSDDEVLASPIFGPNHDRHLAEILTD